MKTVLCILSMLLISCGSTQTATEKGEMSQVQQWAKDKQFTIESNYANPLRGNQISLIGNTNYLTVNKEHVSAYLPFYGQRQIGNVLKGGAIEFEGTPKDVQLIYNQRKKSSIISFTISEKGENYQVTVTLYDNKNSRITVNSSQRDLMRYEGEVEALPEDEK
ncbi:DUF4251 domain-containing protein [uncultured Marixanthomonas sp.]|uniref:DUF4251 domain-containing protein n=1 Tax=uncultured Marixanthomonas sp. TaxID=757245 RepID=UPI0030DCFE8A|tara:strand:+ start:32470 stop:32958 length:489 start_codon:yes stop_codon:yes gene_type:complete